ncbi:MAG: hypothetical protein H7144_12350 [Burkholderiales bacterium]|nr:hypothetical protein [Phycisphaerae bacterium]
MASVLEQLDSNEAILLMYLANELPGEDRAAVERRLHADAALRAQLDQIRLAYASLDHAFGRADSATPLPSTFSAARSFGEAVRIAHRERVSPSGQQALSRRGLYMLLYPASAAAILAMGMLIWWQVATGLDESQNGTRDARLLGDADAGYPQRWDNSWGPGRGRPSVAFNFSRAVVGPVADLNDEDLISAFDSMVVERPLGSQNEYNVITYLNESLQ